jgi:hypothetical protein
MAIATEESDDSKNTLNFIPLNNRSANPKPQSKKIVICYFVGSNKPFKALLDTGADLHLALNTMLNLSNGRTTRKASAIQADGSEY